MNLRAQPGIRGRAAGGNGRPGDERGGSRGRKAVRSTAPQLLSLKRAAERRAGLRLTQPGKVLFRLNESKWSERLHGAGAAGLGGGAG